MLSLVLASNSPRRQDLIRKLVPVHDIVTSDVEEVGSDLAPYWSLEPLDVPTEYAVPTESHPTLWAWRKAVDAARRVPEDADVVVLGADTVVIGEGMILNKPTSPEHAMEMLSSLRGKKHYVATGLVLVKHAGAQVRTLHAGWVLSTVWMREFSEAQLAGYVATGEPLDKAGAYALQGLGGELVDRVEGCYYNVVGLPLCAARNALAEAGVHLLDYPAGGYCRACPHLATAK